MEKSVIEIQGLFTRLGTRMIHENLQLSVQRGEMLALVGSSGSGKTTLLRQILGLESPLKGSISLFGHQVQKLSRDKRTALRRRLGMLFQHGALYSALPVFDNVALPLRELRCFDEDLIKDTVLLTLGMVGIEGHQAWAMPSELSGGMIKRVALARSLVLSPELLFLDEPTAGLDPDRADKFVQLIQELYQSLRFTVVMVTHDRDTLFQMATHVAVLLDRQILIHAPLDEVSRLEHPFVRNFLFAQRKEDPS